MKAFKIGDTVRIKPTFMSNYKRLRGVVVGFDFEDQDWVTVQITFDEGTAITDCFHENYLSPVTLTHPLAMILGWIDAKEYELGQTRFVAVREALIASPESSYKAFFDVDGQPIAEFVAKDYERGYNLALATHVDQRVSK